MCLQWVETAFPNSWELGWAGVSEEARPGSVERQSPRRTRREVYQVHGCSSKTGQGTSWCSCQPWSLWAEHSGLGGELAQSPWEGRNHQVYSRPIHVEESVLWTQFMSAIHSYLQCQRNKKLENRRRVPVKNSYFGGPGRTKTAWGLEDKVRAKCLWKWWRWWTEWQKSKF